MQDVLPFVEQYGYWVLTGVGFAEFAGLPVVSVPVLVGAGALTADTGLHLLPAALAAAAGGLVADGCWFGLGRVRGRSLVSVACRLSSNPSRCVLGVEDRVRALGPRIIIPSKFLPGVGNLLAPAAGFAGVGRWRFLAYDAMALLLWAGVYTGLGRLFSRQVGIVLDAVARFRGTALAVAGVFVLGAAAWRIWGRRHPHPGEGGEEADRGDAGTTEHDDA